MDILFRYNWQHSVGVLISIWYRWDFDFGHLDYLWYCDTRKYSVRCGRERNIVHLLCLVCISGNPCYGEPTPIGLVNFALPLKPHHLKNVTSKPKNIGRLSTPSVLKIPLRSCTHPCTCICTTQPSPHLLYADCTVTFSSSELRKLQRGMRPRPSRRTSTHDLHCLSIGCCASCRRCGVYYSRGTWDR